MTKPTKQTYVTAIMRMPAIKGMAQRQQRELTEDEAIELAQLEGICQAYEANQPDRASEVLGGLIK